MRYTSSNAMVLDLVGVMATVLACISTALLVLGAESEEWRYHIHASAPASSFFTSSEYCS